ncbi:hypothetical protein F2P79_010227 [Pimephales promelas]|nr:hypothetical protein F2P79_010227 [Pimephales promelas]
MSLMKPHKSKKDKCVKSSRKGGKQHEDDQDSENEGLNKKIRTRKHTSGPNTHRRLSVCVSISRELEPLDALTVTLVLVLDSSGSPLVLVLDSVHDTAAPWDFDWLRIADRRPRN